MSFANPPQTPPLYDTLLNLKSEIFKSLRVCLPATIKAIHLSDGTVDVQPAILQTPPKSSPYPYPQLLACPVVTIQGNGLEMSLPPKVGDMCLVFFADRCLDSWKQTGTPNPLPSFRMHDLSDGFALVGLNLPGHPLPTILMTGEGGLSGATAKIAINQSTQKITIANGAGGTNNLYTILSLLLTTLITLNGLLASMTTASIASGATQTAIAALTASLTTVATELALLLY